MFFFFFFSFIARNFSTLFLSIFQVRDDGANGTHGFAMVLSVIDLNEDPSDLSWFSQGLHLPWFRLFTWLYCVATNFLTFFQSFKYTEMGATLSLNSSWLLFDRTSCDNTTEKIKRHGRAHLIHQRGMNEQ